MLIQTADVRRSPATAARARHPAFFPAMSALLLVIVFVGFAPTYYLRPAAARPLPIYLHLHGAALTLWFSLLLAQTGLIASGRRALHRRLGLGGAALGAVIAVLTPFVVIWAIPGFMGSGMPIETTALIVLGDLVALLFFAVLLAVAMRMRRQPEIHSRLLLLASILISSPALGRVSLNAAGTPVPGLLVQMSLPLLLIAHDLIMTRRVHRATVWGTAAVVGSLALSIGMANTEMGQRVVRMLQ